MLKIEDIMSSTVKTVHPDTALMDAVNLLNQTEYKTLPVVDNTDKLIGCLREQDLISNDSFMHLQTLYKLLGSFDYYKKDKVPIQDDLKKILELKVESVMSPALEPLRPDTSIEVALANFSRARASAIPVVNNVNAVIGIVTLADLTKIYGVSLKGLVKQTEVDKQVDSFLHSFEKQFVLVTKTRTRFWLLINMSFAVLGFIVATVLLIRITVQY